MLGSSCSVLCSPYRSAESRQCCACPLRSNGVVGHMCLASQHPSLIDVQINVTKLWLQFSTMILAFVFVFGNSLKVVFEAVVFLFVVHPFDIGDGVIIGTTGTDYYRVRPHTCPAPASRQLPLRPLLLLGPSRWLHTPDLLGQDSLLEHESLAACWRSLATAGRERVCLDCQLTGPRSACQ